MNDEKNMPAGKPVDDPPSTNEHFPVEDTNNKSPLTASELPTTNNKLQTEEMEVHHHGHVHEKKKWKEYVFQFLMLFLAVFCGFLAEYQLEHKIEKDREKVYMQNMLEDVRSDTAKLNRYIIINTEQSAAYDSFLNHWYNKPYADSSIRYMYYLYRRYLTSYSRVLFSQRTIVQLRNAGGMRLIRNRTASDSIMNYYDFVDRANVQIDRFNSVYQHDALQTGYRIFDWSKFRNIATSASAYKILEIKEKFNFLDASISDQNTFIAQIQVAGSVLKNYIRMLHEQQQRSVRLIAVIKTQYHLDDE